MEKNIESIYIAPSHLGLLPKNSLSKEIIANGNVPVNILASIANNSELVPFLQNVMLQEVSNLWVTLIGYYDALKDNDVEFIEESKVFNIQNSKNLLALVRFCSQYGIPLDKQRLRIPASEEIETVALKFLRDIERQYA